MKRVLTLLLLLATAALSDSLEEGYVALYGGDLEKSGQVFATAKGEAGKIARAERALVMVRPDLALSELRGEGSAQQVTRLRALLMAERHNEAILLLRRLEAQEHRLFPHPFDFQFYLARGRIESLLGHAELARKNFDHALSLAHSVDHELQALDRLVSHFLDIDEPEMASITMEKAGRLIGRVRSVWAVAEHLEIVSQLLWSQGQNAAATASNRASRELYLAHGNRVQAARVLARNSEFYLLAGDKKSAFEFAQRALDELLEVGDQVSLDDGLRDLSMQSQPMGQEAQAKLKLVFRRVLEQLPEGAEKNRVRLALADHLWMIGEDASAVTAVLQEILNEGDVTDRDNLCRAHEKLADQHWREGRHEQAMEEFQKALDLAGPHPKKDRSWPATPGVVRLRMGRVEMSRHRYLEALHQTALAIEAQPTVDWALWRSRARRQRLEAAMEVYDLEVAVHETRAILDDLSLVNGIALRADGITTLIADMLLNQALRQDLLDPAQPAMGDYSPMAQRILEEVLRDPQVLSGMLDSFDQWATATRLRKESYSEPLPAIYKGLLLEAVGRLTEAKASVEKGTELALERGNLEAEIHGRLLLARVEGRLGHPESSLDQIAKAAELSRGMTAETAGLYHLIAGSALREGGRFQEALAVFRRGNEIAPERAWAGHYGLALTHERMGRHALALTELENALKALAGGRVVSRGLILGAQGRVLNHRGLSSEAVPLLREAYELLMSSGSVSGLPGVTMDLGNALLAQGDKEQALQVTRQVLDRLLDWQSLSQDASQPLFERVVALALDLGDHVMALRYLQLSRSRDLVNSVNLRDVQSSDPQTQKLLTDVEQLRFRLGRLQEHSSQAVDGSQRDSLGQVLAVTREQFFAKLGQLRQKEPDFESLVQITGSQLSAVQSHLPPDSALIEYFPAQGTLYIFVVTAQEFSLHEVSLSRIDLEKLVSDYLALVVHDHGREEEIRKLSQRLYGLLISTAGPRLESVRDLRIVPAGGLWRMPFSALQNPQGETLSQRFELSYLGSSDLLNIMNSGDRRKRLAAPLLVAGAENLSGVQREIRSLSKILPNSRVILGTESNADSIRKLAPQHDLIHIASHSGISRELNKSFIQLGQDSLTLEQVYGLHLQPGTLVVLSSCRSAVGEEQPGKEVASLASAFGIAGASAVIASRWEVDDQVTAEFFAHFYRALLGGESRAGALRKAQEEISTVKPHPYYWAGFRLLGDPR
jgi:CHAT domain-containing protein/Tfp pilus assembly protein PilF